MSSKLPPSQCPACKKVIDAATIASGKTEVPRPGDFTICIYCGEVLRFGPELELIQADLNDLASLDEPTRNFIGRVQQARKEVMAKRK